MLWWRLRQLRSIEEEKRKRAIQALVKRGHKVIPSLVVECTRLGMHVRSAAVQTLNQIDPKWMKSNEAKQAVPALIAILEHGDYEHDRAAAAEVLGQIGDAQVVKPLLYAASADWYHSLRELGPTAAKALALIDDPKAIQLLLAAFETRATVIGGHGSTRVGVEELIQKSAVKALAQIGQPAVEPLIAALQNKSSLIRRGAAKALREIKDVRSTEPLVESLKDIDPTVLEAVVEALESLGWKPIDAMQHTAWAIARCEWAQLGVAAVRPLLLKIRSQYDIKDFRYLGALRALEDILKREAAAAETEALLLAANTRDLTKTALVEESDGYIHGEEEVDVSFQIVRELAKRELTFRGIKA